MSVIGDAIDGERLAVRDQIRELERRLEALDELATDAERLGLVPTEAPPPIARIKRPRITKPAPTRPVSNGAVTDAVLAQIGKIEPAAKGQIQRAVEASYGEIDKAIVRLVAAGKVSRTGVRAGTRYHLTATLDRQVTEHGRPNAKLKARCRDCFISAVGDLPGAWTERRISDELGFERELVADVAGALLDEGVVILSPDGTYRLAVLEPVL